MIAYEDRSAALSDWWRQAGHAYKDAAAPMQQTATNQALQGFLTVPAGLIIAAHACILRSTVAQWPGQTWSVHCLELVTRTSSTCSSHGAQMGAVRWGTVGERSNWK